MEFRVPVRAEADSETNWVLVRTERETDMRKVITVESNNLETLIIEPWKEETVLLSASASVDGTLSSKTPADVDFGRAGVVFTGSEAKGSVTVTLNLQTEPSTSPTVEPSKPPTKFPPTVAPTVPRKNYRKQRIIKFCLGSKYVVFFAQ